MPLQEEPFLTGVIVASKSEFWSSKDAGGGALLSLSWDQDCDGVFGKAANQNSLIPAVIAGKNLNV
jgi:hypothetical protein